jgi:predicted AAA+ superfamily ATPase
MYIERHISKQAVELFGKYPVLTITGPRQSGKSTLCRKLFSDLNYVSLEDPDRREFAMGDPRGFLEFCGKKAVIDEVQRVPGLLSYIQTLVDTEGTNGRYVLTGSAQFELMESLSQSLAGRTALLRLLPFSFDEICSIEEREKADLRKLLYRGFYPRVIAESQEPSQAYGFYVNTYLERDVRSMVNVHDLQLFGIFLKLCAGRTGQLLNYSALASDCGVDVKTAQRWLSILEAGYIVKIVRPYYRNLNKRLMKTPKLYFYDTGLACYLLGIRKSEHLIGHPLFGAVFETFVVGELLKSAYNSAKEDDLYFFRDNRGREVDIIKDMVTAVDIMEIKSSQTITTDFFKGLKYFRTLPIEVKSSTLLYGGDDTYDRNGVHVLGWRNVAQAFD